MLAKDSNHTIFTDDIFLGQSYGTLLGSTLIAMFPDKIDKAVLDGVINAHEYYHMYVMLCFCPCDDDDVQFWLTPSFLIAM